MANETLFLDQTKAYTVPQDNPSRNYLKGNAGVASWDLPSDQYTYLNGSPGWSKPEMTFHLANHSWNDIRNLASEIMTFGGNLPRDGIDLSESGKQQLLNKYGHLLGEYKTIKVKYKNDETSESVKAYCVSIYHRDAHNSDARVPFVFATEPTNRTIQYNLDDTEQNYTGGIKQNQADYRYLLSPQIEGFKLDTTDPESNALLNVINKLHQVEIVCSPWYLKSYSCNWNGSNSRTEEINYSAGYTYKFANYFFAPSRTELGVGDKFEECPLIDNDVYADYDRNLIIQGSPFLWDYLHNVTGKSYHTRSYDYGIPTTKNGQPVFIHESIVNESGELGYGCYIHREGTNDLRCLNDYGDKYHAVLCFVIG